MIAKPDDKIAVRAFNSIVRESDGVTLVAPDDFLIIDEPENIACKIVDRFIIEATEEHEEMKVGDEVEIIYNGFSYLNLVTKVSEGLANTKYELNESLPAEPSETLLAFRRTTYVISLQDIAEGFYYFEAGERGNEQLIIRKTWAKPYIGYKELVSSFSDAKTIEDGRIKMLNEQAWEEILTDFSSFGNAYDFLFGAEYRTLQKYKILSILENDFETVGERSFSAIYKEYLQKFSMEALKRFDSDSDGVPDGNISTLTMGFSLWE